MYSSGCVDDAVDVEEALLSTRTPKAIELGPVLLAPVGIADAAVFVVVAVVVSVMVELGV